ncbi:OmpA family protein [Cognatishimia activa]|uniref:OmpA family protein n=1 Tax=Cognatishimia activa TaxID=1715691 RepID=UPI00222E5DAA|nr:OmpA family protein [Cognatishimia activa]UZD90552.1 OmpA family protein [Cognatishimia activa]
MNRLIAIMAVSLATTPAFALDLAMPAGSALIADDVQEDGSYALPDGPYLDGYLSSRQVTGHLSRQAWHLDGETHTTEQLIDPLRSQIQAAGFAILLDCDAQSCGGFDFRFATEVLPAPDMFVDLVDYRFVSALKESSSGSEAISALVSTSDTKGYIQLIAVQPGPTSESLPLAKPVEGNPVEPVSVNLSVPTDLAKALDVGGHVVLSDLEFETGSSNLSDGRFNSLQSIATYLSDHPGRRIALVGHTDNVGSLEGNVALSQKRARAVKNRLVETLGVSEGQVEAQGVGYLAPIASNLSEAGRNANRRVEAVLLTE